MLTPSYLLHAVEPAEEIAEKLHTDIMDRVTERVLTRFQRGDDYMLTATDKWNIETVQQAGFLLEDIQKEIVAATGKMDSEIAQAMEDAGVRALEYDDAIYRDAGLDPVPLVQSPYMIQIMQRNFEATLGEWKNFTRISKLAVHQLYIYVCDNAYNQAITGALSITQAIKEAINIAIEAGVYVEYKDKKGNVIRRDTIETAITRAVRTGISQASGNIQTARMDEFGVDLVLVSSHMGARPEHAEWQGKIYSRSGEDPRFPDFVQSTKYGSVTGLCGANCRHSFGPWFEGMDNPFDQYDSEENRKQYELEQKQRTMERRIRDTKRKTMNWKTAADKEEDPLKKALFESEYQRKAALLQKQNKAYNDFCKDNDLKRRDDRISIAKWDRKQAAAARSAAKKAEESIANSFGNDKIKIEKAENNKDIVRQAIQSGEVSAKINKEKQNRHIKDSAGYIKGRSYINGTLEDAQQMVDRLSGTGDPVMVKEKWNKKERVSSETVIGVHIDPKTQEETETRHALIVYSKTGSHIIPRKGE